MGDADVANAAAAAMKRARARPLPAHPALFLSSKKPAECERRAAVAVRASERASEASWVLIASLSVQ